MRRSVGILGAAIAVLLTIGTTTAAGRLVGPPGPNDVQAIEPSFVMLPVSDAPLARPAVGKPAPPKTATAAKTQRVCPTLPGVSAAPTTGAKAVVPKVRIFDRPGGRVVRVLDNPTIEGMPLNTIVKERRGVWMRVQLPIRPNETTGWVFVTDFAQYEVPYSVVVQRCARRVTVFRNGMQVWSKTAAVGKPGTPTPLGTFYVDFVAPMRYGGGVYGPYLVSVAGFSDVLHQFGGKNGIGQIAIHGTNRPSSVGQAVSNGCVRLHNRDLVELVKFLPEGSPVHIVE